MRQTAIKWGTATITDSAGRQWTVEQVLSGYVYELAYDLQFRDIMIHAEEFSFPPDLRATFVREAVLLLLGAGARVVRNDGLNPPQGSRAEIADALVEHWQIQTNIGDDWTFVFVDSDASAHGSFTSH